MPTKILVLETATFQIGANAGETAERMDPSAFPARLKKHFAESGTSKDTLFVLAPSEIRLQSIFAEAANGPGSVSLAFFSSIQDAIRFLPSLLIFAGDGRSQGLKDCLASTSTIYSDTIFNGKAVGGRLDPCFTFARTRLNGTAATNAWGCMQSLVCLGLQNLPDHGEKGTGEKVDVQIGADEKYLAFTVRFDVKLERLAVVRENPIITLPRFAVGVYESRYIQNAGKIEFNCVFFRKGGAERPIEIISFHRETELESASSTRDFQFKPFSALTEGFPAEERKAGGGFKKKFSDQVKASDPVPEAAPKVTVSGNASLSQENSSTAAKGDATAAKVLELEAKLKSLEANLKVRDEALAKATKELSDPNKKRDVISGIKDSQSEGLKQTVKNLETELEEAKTREKELMKMVDKAVQMKDEAAKKIKELDMKLKQAAGVQGSKVTLLEKQVEEQKRQNKELSARVSELTNQLKAA